MCLPMAVGEPSPWRTNCCVSWTNQKGTEGCCPFSFGPAMICMPIALSNKLPMCQVHHLAGEVALACL